MNKQELEQAFNETTDNAVDLLKENVELRNRIDKAIEYMKNYIEVEPLNEPVKIEFEEVINILKGEDKE